MSKNSGMQIIVAFIGLSGVIFGVVVQLKWKKAENDLEKEKICIVKASTLLENVQEFHLPDSFRDVIKYAIVRGNCDTLEEYLVKADSIALINQEMIVNQTKSSAGNSSINNKVEVSTIYIGSKFFELRNYPEYGERVSVTIVTEIEVHKIEVDWDDGNGKIFLPNFHSKKSGKTLLYSFANWYIKYNENPNRKIIGKIYYKNGETMPFSKCIKVNI